MALRVYYIDDEPMLCEVIETLLSAPDVEIKSFVDYQQALNQIQAAVPDIVFIDYHLNGITGVEVAAKMDANIIKYLVTGEVDATKPNGFAGVVRKPFDIGTLTSIVQNAKK